MEPQQSDHPLWWHLQALKEVTVAFNAFEKTGRITRSCVEIGISGHQKGENFAVDWGVFHGSDTGLDDGQRIFSMDLLRAAFDPAAQDMIVEGYFAKKGQHLNIPGRGTRSVGDPNVSVWLTNEIYQMIQRLIDYCAGSRVVKFSDQIRAARSRH